MRARDNPFSTARLYNIRYRFHDSSWDQLLSGLERRHYRGAIVGPEGSGKTTLLEDLEPKLRELDFTPVRLRLTREAPRFSPVMEQMLESRITDRHVLLFDGCEQMGWMAWNRFRWRQRDAGGLIITLHRSGRLPTVHKCATSVELLTELVKDLVSSNAVIEEAQILKTYRRHRGNVRAALREFYDLFALGRVTPSQPAASSRRLQP